MDEFFMTVSMLMGVLLRIGLPVGLTFLLARYLRRLDAKWRAEAREAQPGEAILREIWLSNPCYDEIDCSEEQRENCIAYGQKDKACWEVYQENGDWKRETGWRGGRKLNNTEQKINSCASLLQPGLKVRMFLSNIP